MEEYRSRIEDPQHNEEGEEVEDRTHGSDKDHKFADQANVPAVRLFDVTLVDMIGGNRNLRQVVQEVVEQDLFWQHGQEWQEDVRPRHTKHIAEIGTGAHQQVFDHVAEGFASLQNTVVQDLQTLFEQDDIGCILGDIDGGGDRDAHVCCV